MREFWDLIGCLPPLLAGRGHPISGCTLAKQRSPFHLSSDVEGGDLLGSLLASLLADFDHWFTRGQAILEQCPDSVLLPGDRLELAERLADGKRAIAATRSLLEASSEPVAVSMKAMAPWHQLVMEVWALSARVSRSTR